MNLKKLGIFGGSFDPIHIGHLIEAQYAAEELGLEKLLFIPTGDHPLKAQAASSEARLEMTKLAIEGNSLFEISDIEIKRTGKSYTIDTVNQVKKLYAPEQLYLLVGMDNVDIFHKWHRIDEILDICKVVVLSRMMTDDYVLSPSLLEKTMILDSPIIETSSTEIRERLEDGKEIRYLVPDSIREYIRSHSLYGSK
ncbi:MAG: nicotinate-nucleotide adenylyltransferase [Ignavibacteriota bacterium]